MFDPGHYPAEILARQMMQGAPTAVTDIHPTTGLQQFGFAIIFFFPALALCALFLRIWSRTSTKQFGLDDLLVTIAMALSIGETVATYYFMKTNYIGIHLKDIPPHDPVPPLIWNFAVQVLYNPILALVKTSILLFLLRLGAQKAGVRWAIHSLNAFNMALMVAIFLVVLFQCDPIAYNWDMSIPGGKCVHQGAFYVATAALTIFTDLLVLALPLWIFLDLKMALKLKIALLFVFLLGFIVTVVSVVRLVYIYRAFFTIPDPNSDPTYTLGFCTSAIETNLAIVTASAPALRPLFRKWFPRMFSSRSKYGGASTRYADNFGSSNNGLGNTSRVNSVPGSAFALRELKASKVRTEVRGSSPTASQEEIMTYDGIVRTTNISVKYQDHGKQQGMESVSDSGKDGRASVRTSASISL